MNRKHPSPLSQAFSVGKPDSAELWGVQHGSAQLPAKLLAARAVGFKVARRERLKTLQCQALIACQFAAAAAAVSVLACNYMQASVNTYQTPPITRFSIFGTALLYSGLIPLLSIHALMAESTCL